MVAGSVPIDLAIAGLHFGLRPSEVPIADALAPAWRPFLVAADGAETILELSLDPSRAEPPGPRTMPSFVRGPDCTLRLATAGFDATVSADLRSVSICQGPGRFPLETVLKLVLAERLLRSGGVLLHSVGVASPEGAAVFSGVSGAGKSTLGANARAGGLRLLADELVAIVEVDGVPVAYGTPWNVGNPCSAPLRLLGLLAHSPGDSVESIPKSEVLRTLASNTVLPTEDAETRASVFTLLLRFVEATRCVRLSFAPHPEVSAAVSRAILG